MDGAANQTTLLSPASDPRRSYVLSRWVFLRLLGVVYLVAFWSLGVQVTGLIGERGLLPAGQYLSAIKQAFGSAGYWLAPTLCWLSASNTMLRTLTIGGGLLAVMLILDVAPTITLLLLWMFYLSLTVAGQVFLNFQWDALLLEAGLAAIFYAPATLRPSLLASREPSAAGRWLIWLLLFKLMVLSGETKLLSRDATWGNLTALTYHFQTQPLPTWVGWYFHAMPLWFQETGVVVTLAIEIVAPMLILVPPPLRVLRLWAAALMILLQLLIALTGNYGFFNLLSIVLCLALLDDGVWRRVWPARWTPLLPASRERPAWQRVTVIAASILLPLSGLAFVRELVDTPPRGGAQAAGWANRVARWVAPLSDRITQCVAPLRSVNGYGLFRVMTTKRQEIVIEASRDGQTWHEVEFRYKPGDVDRRPGFCAPHMPRLDWQMWFAALAPERFELWRQRLVERLLQGTPEVVSLLAPGPFSQHPPRLVRLVLYEYRFAPEKPGHHEWWTRTWIKDLTPPLSLRQ